MRLSDDHAYYKKRHAFFGGINPSLGRQREGKKIALLRFRNCKLSVNYHFSHNYEKRVDIIDSEKTKKPELWLAPESSLCVDLVKAKKFVLLDYCVQFNKILPQQWLGSFALLLVLWEDLHFVKIMEIQRPETG